MIIDFEDTKCEMGVKEILKQVIKGEKRILIPLMILSLA